jgi:hypothetical protein
MRHIIPAVAASSFLTTAFSTGSARKGDPRHRELNREHGLDYKEIDPEGSFGPSGPIPLAGRLLPCSEAIAARSVSGMGGVE